MSRSRPRFDMSPTEAAVQAAIEDTPDARDVRNQLRLKRRIEKECAARGLPVPKIAIVVDGRDETGAKVHALRSTFVHRFPAKVAQ